MNKSDTHAFVNQLLVYTLVMICFTGSVGLGTVWFRHRISTTANESRKIEASIAEIERRIAETTALIAAEQSPDALEQKNAAMRLGLVRTREAQMVRITESPEQRLVARRNIEIFSSDSVRLAPIDFRLAGNANR
ncbi:MAG TPA: hypothetical protein VGD88_07830 [Opitutaceae bacterium]